MRTRMQPLDKLFGKYPRLIRDLAFRRTVNSLEETIDYEIKANSRGLMQHIKRGQPAVVIGRDSREIKTVRVPALREKVSIKAANVAATNPSGIQGQSPSERLAEQMERMFELATEHTEIAAYELLERLAQRAWRLLHIDAPRALGLVAVMPLLAALFALATLIEPRGGRLKSRPRRPIRGILRPSLAAEAAMLQAARLDVPLATLVSAGLPYQRSTCRL